MLGPHACTTLGKTSVEELTAYTRWTRIRARVLVSAAVVESRAHNRHGKVLLPNSSALYATQPRGLV